MSVNTKQLREQRAKVANDANAILRKQTVSSEDRIQVDKLLTQCDKLGTQIDTEEKEEALQIASADLDSKKFRALELPRDREYRMTFDKYMRKGLLGISNEERSSLFERRSVESRDGQLAGTQSISYTQGAAGGYYVPVGFVHDIDIALKYYAPLMDGSVCRILETAGGGLLPYPTVNDAGNRAALLAEAAEATELDVAVGVKNFGAWKFTSKLIKVSTELLQDSAFDLQSFLTERFAERFGRTYEVEFTTGSGINRPTGIVTAVLASGISPVIAGGSSPNDGSGAAATSIGTPDLVALEHSVDRAYRRGAKFMFHDNTLKSIKNLLDKYGRPIWLPGLAVNAPDTILGYPFVVNNSMDSAVTASKNTVLFGDFSKFIIRKVKDMSVLRLDERYAEFGQVGFLAFSRVDSNLVWDGSASSPALQILQQHS
jgi:HK97 family phage major capsid protein